MHLHLSEPCSDDRPTVLIPFVNIPIRNSRAKVSSIDSRKNVRDVPTVSEDGRVSIMSMEATWIVLVKHLQRIPTFLQRSQYVELGVVGLAQKPIEVARLQSLFVISYLVIRK